MQEREQGEFIEGKKSQLTCKKGRRERRIFWRGELENRGRRLRKERGKKESSEGILGGFLMRFRRKLWTWRSRFRVELLKDA